MKALMQVDGYLHEYVRRPSGEIRLFATDEAAAKYRDQISYKGMSYHYDIVDIPEGAADEY